MKLATETIEAIADRRVTSLTAIVRDELERLIISGELPAGQRLNEQQLATQFGVSRGPLREALRALERAGLVTSVVNFGMFVRQVGIEEAVEIYDMRGVVFGFACARLAETVTDAQTADLQARVEEMDRSIEAGGRPDYYRLNLAFHDIIIDYAGHTRASLIYRSLLKETHLLRQRALAPVASMRQSNAEHRAMVAAIAAGDAAGARAAAELHHAGGKRRWLETL